MPLLTFVYSRDLPVSHFHHCAQIQSVLLSCNDLPVHVEYLIFCIGVPGWLHILKCMRFYPEEMLWWHTNLEKISFGFPFAPLGSWSIVTLCIYQIKQGVASVKLAESQGLYWNARRDLREYRTILLWILCDLEFQPRIRHFLPFQSVTQKFSSLKQKFQKRKIIRFQGI